MALPRLAFRRDPLALYTEAARLGPLVQVKMGKTDALIASSPETIHQLLVEHADAFVKTDNYRRATTLLGQGLPQVEGAQHRRQRRQMAPGFAHRRLEAFGQVMVQMAEDTQRRWHDGQRLDLCAEVRKLNLAIVAKTLFDAELQGEASAIDRALHDVDRLISGRLAARMKLPDWVPTPRATEAKRAIARLDRTIERILDGRNATDSDRGDLLSLLLAQGLERQALRDEMLALLIACQDTTPNAVTWAFNALIRTPEARQDLEDELDRVLSGRSPSPLDAPRLTQASHVFKETLRLHPPVYVTGRKAVREVTLGDLRVRPGTVVFANIYGLHRRAEAFPEPERFLPERWQGDLEKRLPRASYLPFIDGPRVCIGNAFALMEGQLLLATLAQRVTFEATAGEVVPDPMVTLRPRDGLWVVVRRRG